MRLPVNVCLIVFAKFSTVTKGLVPHKLNDCYV